MLVELVTTFAVIGLETAVATGFTALLARFFFAVEAVAPRIALVKTTNKRINWEVSKVRFFIGGFLAKTLNR